MPRPHKFRRVCCMPATECFGPIGSSAPDGCPELQMSVDEYETIRLMDLEGCTQEECAVQMGIARTTVQGIYNEARGKLAEVLVYGKRLTIVGGNYTLCENFKGSCTCGCENKCHKGGKK